MARNQSRRLKPSIIQADENCYAALTAIDNYAPLNPAFSIDALTAARTETVELRQVETTAHRAAAVARCAALTKEWEFHNLMLGVKAQVIAQFGFDSDELASLGRKKKSDYKRPGRKPAFGTSSG